MNRGAAEISVSMGRHVGSPSSTGSVPVTQSTILVSPVLVFCSDGWSRSTPESTMPMVTPRPSYFLLAFLNATEPVSCVGMYGLAFGVFAPGAAEGEEPPVEALPGAGSSIGIVSSRSIASTREIFATCSTVPVGTEART